MKTTVLKMALAAFATWMMSLPLQAQYTTDFLLTDLDNPTAKENVTRYAVHQGYKVSVEEKDGEFTLSITK